MILVSITHRKLLTKSHGSLLHLPSFYCFLGHFFSSFPFSSSQVTWAVSHLRHMACLLLEFSHSSQDFMRLGLLIIHGGVLKATVLQPSLTTEAQHPPIYPCKFPVPHHPCDERFCGVATTVLCGRVI